MLGFIKNKILTYYHEAKQIKVGEMPIPRMALIYPSYACNHHCPGCHYKDWNKHHSVNPHMDFSKFTFLLLELKKMGVESLEYCGGGDPTMHPQFDDMLKFIESLKFKFGLFTNGSLLNLDRQKLLVSMASYIRISVDDEINWQLLKELVETRNNLNSHTTIGAKILINSVNLFKLEKKIYKSIDECNVDYVQIKQEKPTNQPLTNEQLDQVSCIKKNNRKILGTLNHTKLTNSCWLTPIHTMIDVYGDVYICCMPGNSLITKKTGRVEEIKNIKFNDLVLTHRGRYKKVTQLWKRPYKGNMVRIKSLLHNDLYLTPEHSVLAIKQNLHKKNQKINPLEWIEAQNLTKEYFIVSPRTDKIENLNISLEHMKFLGYWIAEGCRHNTKKDDGIIIAFHRDETNFISEVISYIKKRYFLIPKIREIGKTIVIQAFSLKAKWGEILPCYYERSKERTLPDWIFGLSNNHIIEFLKGLFNGDGHWDKRSLRYTTASLNLANQVVYLLQKLGVVSRIYTAVLPNAWDKNKTVIRHTVVLSTGCFSKAQLLTDKIPADIKVKRKINFKWWVDEKYCYYPITEIKNIEYDDYVYNIGVEEDNTYVANNIVVHNCYFQFRKKSHKIGNVFKDGFEKVWYSQRHKDVISNIKIEECNVFDCRFHSYNKDMVEFLNNSHLEFC